MKVEEVGERSQEEVLDQSLYANINAEWVNRKGMFQISAADTTNCLRSLTRLHSCARLHRCMDHPSSAHSHRESRD